MTTPLQEESPRIAKITSSAQQFRELINSLRNNQIKARQQQNAQPIQVENSPKNDSQLIQQPTTTVNEKPSPSSNLFQESQDVQRGLKFVPKTDVGGRDQLKKHKIVFDAKPEQLPSKAIEGRKQAAVQFQESKSKQMSFSFESPRKSVSIQCQGDLLAHATPIQSSFLMNSSKINHKAGHIIRQHIKNQPSVQSQPIPTKRIRDINQNLVIDYCKREKVVQKSQPSQIFSFFTNLCLSCDVIVRSPTIKKFKNCIYYGFAIQRDEPYEGFLYFYDSRIYFGEFLNGLKHGLGVQLAINDEIKYKGEFSDGRKTGKFYVEKPTEKYIGYLENGLYQGEGRLSTADYVYEGLFDQGEKNGYGQEFYPKTGVKISGIFKNGVLAKTRASKSIAQLREKSKGKEKQRLQAVRKKSLEKHSARMNKVRSFRESEYEIDFEPQTDYNELPRIHFNPNKLEVYRQPIQKLPKITHEHQFYPEAGSRMESLVSKPAHTTDVRKRGRQSGRAIGMNPERMSSSQNEQPLPTPCLSYPRRES